MRSDAFDAFGISEAPTVVLIQKDGRVLRILQGYQDKDALQAEIKAAGF